MSLVWRDDVFGGVAEFSSTKQCRDFDVIHAWAKEREY
jgi:hypothetical protein